MVVGLFFSSRRRHTRWPRDWSSDVCSSDLDRDVEPVECRRLHPDEDLALTGRGLRNVDDCEGGGRLGDGNCTHDYSWGKWRTGSGSPDAITIRSLASS